MRPRTAIGKCRTCQIPVRMDIDPDTGTIVAVYAVCDCPRPSVEQANRDLARDRARRALTTVKARPRPLRRHPGTVPSTPPAPTRSSPAVIEEPPPATPVEPVASLPTSPPSPGVRCEVCHLPVSPTWAAQHGPRHGNHRRTA